MNGYRLGYHNQNFTFNAAIQVGQAESGFSLTIGKSGVNFYPAIALSGYSGYIFDQSGRFVHGYRKNEVFNFSGNYFFGDTTTSGNVIIDDTGIARFSYFINDTLISNNISGQTGFIDSLLFEDYGGENSLYLDIARETGSPTVLADNTGTYLLSSDGYYLGSL